ncbi:hypothetical protein EV363DRAFT_1428666 [Boletus edulis]|nr:hypothetical protein EV363DRAFT_1428666 [Boletus edulis]
MWNAPLSQLLMFIMQFQCLLPQLARHFMDAFNRIHYAVDHFEMFTYDPIDFDSRYWQQKEILTPTAESKASFHEPRVSFAFAHSLKSGGRVV